MSRNYLPMAVALHPYVSDAQLAFDLFSFECCPGGHAIAGHGGVAVSPYFEIVLIVSSDDRFLCRHANLTHHCGLINADANWRRNHNVVGVDAIQSLGVDTHLGLRQLFFQFPSAAPLIRPLLPKILRGRFSAEEREEYRKSWAKPEMVQKR